jgi:hypothetical protein
MKARFWFVLIAFLVAAGAGAVSVSALEEAQETALGPNLLFNPSFEGPYSAYDPLGGHPDCIWGICDTAKTAAGWTPYWRSHNTADDPWIINMPEFDAEGTAVTDPVRVRDGEAAQSYYKLYSTFEAGVYQQVDVTPGVTYCFSAWGHSWSARDSPLDPGGDAYSGPDYGNFRQRVGMDPFGGTEWQSSDIVWGPLRIQYDYYEPFVVTATAQSETITVYVYAQPEWAMKHNDAYWDDASLQQIEPILPDGPLTLVTTVDRPLAITRTINANWLCDPETSWEVNLDPDGALTPLLSAADGATGDALTVSMDSQGLAPGTYETALHFASPDTSFAVATIPVTVHVLPHDNDVFLPTLVTGQ